MNKNTKVINLFAGPSAGKSTLACDLFARMKQQGKSVELVREVAKNWAWEGKQPTVFDQFYFLGKQSHIESNLYGKVDYIITDSPVLLASFYMEYYFGIERFAQPALDFYDLAKNWGVTHKNFFLDRHGRVYSMNGRFQLENESTRIDTLQKEFLNRLNVSYEDVNVKESERVGYILRKIDEEEKKQR